MKLTIITGLIALSGIAFTAQAIQPPSYTITGKIKGLTDGTTVEMIPGGTQKDEKPSAAAVVKNGIFTFKGNVAGPRLYHFRVKGTYGGCNIMVENADISVQGIVSKKGRTDAEMWDFDSLKVSGSPTHDQYLKIVEPRNNLEGLYTEYHEKNKDILDKLDAARKAKDTALTASLSRSDAWKKFEADEGAFFKKVEFTMDSMIVSNKDSWWGPFIMLTQMNYFRPSDTTYYNAFSPEAKNSYYGKVAHERLFPEGFKGKKAPLVKVKDIANKRANPISLAKNNKYVLVDFWASWCAPCRRKIPELKRLYEKYHSKGFEIVSISIDKKEPDWRKALGEEKMAWPNYLDLDSETADAWKVRAIPAVFLLDSKGVVVAENMSEEDIVKMLEE